jgi:hypothetical protein
MEAVGQPYTRLGRTFGFCAKAPGADRVLVKVRFTPGGKVLSVRRGR